MLLEVYININENKLFSLILGNFRTKAVLSLYLSSLSEDGHTNLF